MRGKGSRHIQSHIPAEVHEDLKHSAVDKSISLGEIICSILVANFEQRKKEGKVWEQQEC